MTAAYCSCRGILRSSCKVNTYQMCRYWSLDMESHVENVSTRRLDRTNLSNTLNLHSPHLASLSHSYVLSMYGQFILCPSFRILSHHHLHYLSCFMSVKYTLIKQKCHKILKRLIKQDGVRYQLGW